MSCRLKRAIMSSHFTYFALLVLLYLVGQSHQIGLTLDCAASKTSLLNSNMIKFTGFLFNNKGWALSYYLFGSLRECLYLWLIDQPY